MEEFNTPMMKQYMQIKKQYEDCLLFFRMGDFYELFLQDAITGAKVLDITLTSRAKGKDGRVPMAGVPYHAVDIYLAKLVKAGYKVAICEQVSEPNKYGIVDREVIRVVTPGTVLDEKVLNKKENNFIISISLDDKTLGIAAADISTGQFLTSEYTPHNLDQILADELARLQPSECILPEHLYNQPHFLKMLKHQRGMNIYLFQQWNTFAHQAESILKKQFGVKTLIGFEIEDKQQALYSSAALIGYLRYTQKDHINHFKTITALSADENMILDRSTILNLELFSTIREHDKRGSLIHFLDNTITAMGGRMLRTWVHKPLIQKKYIIERHEMVEELCKKTKERTILADQLKEIWDIERILSRLSVGMGNPKDFVSIKLSLQMMLQIKKQLKPFSSSLSQHLSADINTDISQVIDLIETYIQDNPPFDLKEGGIIKDGVDKELDVLRKKVKVDKDWILNLEKSEQKRTGVSSLKVRFNKVFGFYIEMSKSNTHLAPKNYIRKQTLVNGERYITPELKEKEEFILSAEEKMNKIEYELFLDVLEKVLKYTIAMQQAAQAIATLDCLLGFATLAERERYVRPKIIDTGEITIKAGRHPVVEKLLDASQFVPNDVVLNHKDHQLILITGPNMAGKSVFIRQVALIVLLNQMGSFVPAEEAQLSVVDRIFVRSGASDVITSGLSTFMVEMVETAQILHKATNKSLIIMDEIGRGTSTYDGISIAWAVAEYLVTRNNIAPKTLFATHYHELQELEKQYPRKIRNYHMAVEEQDGEPIFLHVILPGGASHSYGVAVAKLAGVPEEVIQKAAQLLPTLENRRVEKPTKQTSSKKNVLAEKLKEIHIEELTPLEALNILAKLKKESVD